MMVIQADFTLHRAFDWHPCGVLVLNEWEIVNSFTWKVEQSSNGALQVSWQLTIQAYSSEVQEASSLLFLHISSTLTSSCFLRYYARSKAANFPIS